MDFSKKHRAILEKALHFYGIDKQLDIAVKKMSELTKAIIKHRRYATRETYENLCEEIADVAIVIEQIIFTTKGGDVARYATAKIERLEQKVIRKAKAKDELQDISIGVRANVSAADLCDLILGNAVLDNTLILETEVLDNE